MMRRYVVVLLAGLMSVPALAQRTSLADRISSLEQQSAAQMQGASQANIEVLNKTTQIDRDGQTEAARSTTSGIQEEHAVTVLGQCTQSPVLRSGARPGDARPAVAHIVLTGPGGGSWTRRVTIRTAGWSGVTMLVKNWLLTAPQVSAPGTDSR